MRQRLAIAGLVVVLSATAQAQQGLRDRNPNLAASQEIASELRRARLRYGPFYLLSSITLSDIGYQSEYYAPTAEQSSGITFGISAPNRLYFVPTRKSVYSLEVTPEYSFFTGRTANQFGYRLRGDAHYLFNHLYLDFYATQSRTLRAYTGEIDRLVTAAPRSGGLVGELKYSSRTSLGFSASTSSLRHPLNYYQPTDIPVELLDRTEQAYRASFNHKTFPLTSLQLIAERSNYGFRYATFKNSHRTFIGPGLKYDNGLTSFGIEVGQARLDFKDPSQRDYRGVMGNITFARRAAVWQLNLSGMRDAEFSILNNAAYYLIDRAQLEVAYAATRKLKLRFGSNAGIDHYQTFAIAPGGALIMRRDTMSFTWVGFIYTWRRLNGGIDVGYYTRDTNFAAVEKRNGIRTVLHLSLNL